MDTLEEMKQQHKLLQEVLNKQRIVNQNLIRNSIMSKVSSFRRQYYVLLGNGIFSTLFSPLIFFMLGCSWPFCLFTCVMVLADVVGHWTVNHKLRTGTITSEPVTVVLRKLLKMKLRNARTHRYGMLCIVPWFAWLVIEMAYIIPLPHDERVVMIVSAAVGLVIGLVIGISIYRRQQRITTDIIRQLRALDE